MRINSLKRERIFRIGVCRLLKLEKYLKFIINVVKNIDVSKPSP